MDNIKIDSAAALEQAYEMESKKEKYLELKVIIPFIDNIKDLEMKIPLVKISNKKTGPIEQALLIQSLENVIATIRDLPGVKETCELFNKNIETKTDTIIVDKEK